MMIEVVEKVEALTRDDMLVRCLTAECNEFNVESMNDLDLGYEDERFGTGFLNNKEL